MFVDSDIKGAPGGVGNGSVNVAGSRGCSALATGASSMPTQVAQTMGNTASASGLAPVGVAHMMQQQQQHVAMNHPSQQLGLQSQGGILPHQIGQASGQPLNGPHHGQAHGQPGAPQQSGTNRPSPPSWYSPNDHIAERRKMVCIFYERSLCRL